MNRLLAIGGLVVALVLILLTLAWCSERKRANEARGDQAVAEGRTTSAVEAIDAITDLGQRADVTDTEVKEAQDAIRQASPADRDRVFRHRLCVLQHRADCDRLLGTGPVGPAYGDAAR